MEETLKQINTHTSDTAKNTEDIADILDRVERQAQEIARLNAKIQSQDEGLTGNRPISFG